MSADTGGQAATHQPLSSIIKRAQELDLGGEFDLPPGDALSHFGAGFAKVLASAIFITGLEPNFAAENVGYFTAPYEHRKHVQAINVDPDNQTVSVQLDNGVTRIAKIFKSQGAITIPLGETDIFFNPTHIAPQLTPQTTCVWPETSPSTLPASIDSSKLNEAIELAFAAEAMTAAYVVTHRGHIIAERYGDGIGPKTPLESWSMGKSLTATLLGRLIHQGAYDLDQPAPIPEWQHGNDPRAAIRIRDIVNMSSGLRFRAMQDPDYDPTLGYPDHLYLYTGGINAFAYAASKPPQWRPGEVGRYRNGDPALANYLIRLAVEARGDTYHAFPQRALFDKLGIQHLTMETDPYGNFLTQGYELGSARDWAKLGNLYLNDGIWNGDRLLPEGWANFVSTLAPSWLADNRPIYGGFFWINGDGALPIPKESYFMAGAGDQRTFIIPSHDLVVVRLGHYGGTPHSLNALRHSLSALMDAIPRGK